MEAIGARASDCGRVAVAVEDGTERTGRVTRRQRGAVVEALEVESVRRGLHGCRLLQLPVSRSAEVQRKEVSCRETGKTGERSVGGRASVVSQWRVRIGADGRRGGRTGIEVSWWR